MRRALLAVPFVLLAMLILLRWLTGTRLGLLPLMSLGPATAALTSWQIPPSRSRLQIAYIAATGVIAAAAGLVSEELDSASRPHETAMFAAISVMTALGVVIARRQWQTEAELLRARCLADAVQGVILRPLPARIGPVQLTAWCTSADAGAVIGGDFYEVVPVNGKIRVVMGDVQGKGLAAARISVLASGIFREAAAQGMCIEAAASRMDWRLQDELGAEQFVTAALAEIDASAGRAYVISCGHPVPLLLPPGWAVPAPIPGVRPGPPLGLGLSGEPVKRCMVPFGPGSALLFYTDGVSEARNISGDFFPLADRAAARGESGLVDRLAREATQHAKGTARDDMTMLLAHHEELTGRGSSTQGAAPGR